MFSLLAYTVKRKFKVMINNSTNINRANNHRSPHNSLNIKKKTTTYDGGNAGPGLE
jgi:hypothetical protein